MRDSPCQPVQDDLHTPHSRVKTFPRCLFIMSPSETAWQAKEKAIQRTKSGERPRCLMPNLKTSTKDKQSEKNFQGA